MLSTLLAMETTDSLKENLIVQLHKSGRDRMSNSWTDLYFDQIILWYESRPTSGTHTTNFMKECAHSHLLNCSNAVSSQVSEVHSCDDVDNQACHTLHQHFIAWDNVSKMLRVGCLQKVLCCCFLLNHLHEGYITCALRCCSCTPSQRARYSVCWLHNLTRQRSHVSNITYRESAEHHLINVIFPSF